jgi:hypothetical protein
MFTTGASVTWAGISILGAGMLIMGGSRFTAKSLAIAAKIWVYRPFYRFLQAFCLVFVLF